MAVGGEEPATVWRSVGIDPVPEPVDDDMVMEPAEGGEVGGIGRST